MSSSSLLTGLTPGDHLGPRDVLDSSAVAKASRLMKLGFASAAHSTASQQVKAQRSNGHVRMRAFTKRKLRLDQLASSR